MNRNDHPTPPFVTFSDSELLSQLQSLEVRITRLGHGLPIGGNVEYADAITLNRTPERREGI